MGVYTLKLPDVGEGIAEAELVEWNVKSGDYIREDDPVAAVMTDKATIEIPSPVAGRVLNLGGEIGEKLAIGCALLELETEGGNPAKRPVGAAGKQVLPPPPKEAPAEAVAPAVRVAPFPEPVIDQTGHAPRPEGEKPLASPAVRKRAIENGIDLRKIPGSGPAGRITHADLDQVFSAVPEPGKAKPARHGETAVPVVGLRRKIAERLTRANARIPHITYVEEVDVTELENLRAAMNARAEQHQPKLTLLPFLIRALVRALPDHPNLNAHYDDESEVVTQFDHVNLGIATQTPRGLMVPVIKHAHSKGVHQLASQIQVLSRAARTGVIAREDLRGSTITVSSLGPKGGLVSTPILNQPEVAILAVNRIRMQPVWDGAGFTPRKMMNLSSSFDHRIIDGWDAASFVQDVKTLLETPAMIFVDA